MDADGGRGVTIRRSHGDDLNTGQECNCVYLYICTYLLYVIIFLMLCIGICYLGHGVLIALSMGGR